MTVAHADVYDALYSHLTANSTFNTSLGGDASTAGRLAWGRSLPDDAFPRAVLTIVDGGNFDAFDKDGFDVRIQVSIWGDEAGGARAVQVIGDQLMARLNGASVSATGHQIITPISDVLRGPYIEEETWRVDMDFIIQGFEN
jgi:hypothetical protein